MVRIWPPREREPHISVNNRHVRSKRTFPGERLQDLGPMIERLQARNRELRAFKGLFKNATSIRERRVRSNRVLATTEPNAPLLIRIVRDPYTQEVTSGRRRKLFEAGMVVRKKVVRPAPVGEARELRSGFVQGNPVKRLAIHPQPLPPPPSVDEWLASRGGA